MPKYSKDITHIITQEEVTAMLFKAQKPRDRFLVAILYLTGARPIELLRLTKEDIVPQDGGGFRARIFTAKLRKAGGAYHNPYRNLDFPAGAPFVDIVLQYSGSYANPKIPLLHGGNAAGSISRRRMEKIIERLSGGTLCPYNFRHTRLFKLAEGDANIQDLMYWKGADDFDSVKNYLRAKPIGRRLEIK